MNAQDRALTALRADLRTGALGPGAQIVQETLAERYGVSRVPLREALKTLAAEGQVVHHPNRGYFVTALSVADLVEVYRLRELLEAEAIQAAVARLTDADVDAIADLLADVARASAAADIDALTATNRRFHFAIFDAAALPRLSRILHQLWDATEAYRTLYFTSARNRARVDREHAAMLTALRRRDGRRLVRLHDDHRRHSVAEVRPLIEGDGGPSQ